MRTTTTVRPVLVGLLALAVGACVAPRNIQEAQHAVRHSLTTMEAADADALVDRLRTLYREDEDRVLFNLERGTLLHFAGAWSQSTQAFEQAERQIEQLYTKSINQGLQSILINDLQLAYDGEDYEDVYLNAFKCLNFLHQEDYSGALVEVRRMAHKLQNLNAKYKGLAATLAHADTTAVTRQLEEEGIAWAPRESAIQHSALGRYLATVLYAKAGQPDDARIEYENLRVALRDQGRFDLLSASGLASPGGDSLHYAEPRRSRGGPVASNGGLADAPPDADPRDRAAAPEATALGRIRQPETYNTLLLAFGGFGPRKVERKISVPLVEPEVQLDFAVPTLHTSPSRIHRVRVRTKGAEPVPLLLLEDMQQVAEVVYRVKEPIVYARAAVRTFVKAAATEAGEALATERGGAWLGETVELIGRSMSWYTERADVRTWQSMPGRAYANVVRLPAGAHDVTFEYLSRSGRVLHTDTRTVHVSGPDDLALAESLLWK